ncbi:MULTISPECIES: alpha/beta fold hydrolase [Halolamina]|uniref:Pimeloyl-ACP methyl ester carboxylesterase n=1 Tax=Halolamina pelagica TaxID=699431 RepID=A0A1I5M2D4_9EURY|nr:MULTISPECIES: alpha/beta hydrolase [Halolamina]NHX35802.1 alpha/beta fold hydrolase [Halolamina sp. R1-12]SFP03116.1 Pimeloyl-ACP methyl ester carboxylesterase [Halolamina pelagica]
MPTAHNGDVALSYDREGPKSAPTVVFVEGLGYGTWMWQFQRDPLSETYDTIVFDNRGTGDSDCPEGPYTIAEMAGDLAAVLDDAGVEEAHVVGASMGGMIAQRFALDDDRARSLALLCTSHGGEDAVPVPEETQAFMFDVPEDADEREAIRYKMTPAISDGFAEEHPDLVERIVDWRLDSDASEAGRTAQAAAVQAFDASDELDELSVPTLIMHGTDDEVLPVENAHALAERLPHAELELFEGGPHLFFVEQPDAVADRLRTFLDAHAR